MKVDFSQPKGFLLLIFQAVSRKALSIPFSFFFLSGVKCMHLKKITLTQIS